MNNKSVKKLGVGSLSLPILALTIIFTYGSIKQGDLGFIMLSKLNLEGFLYPITIMVLLFVAFLSKRYEDHYFTKISLIASTTLLLFFAFALILSFIK